MALTGGQLSLWSVLMGSAGGKILGTAVGDGFPGIVSCRGKYAGMFPGTTPTDAVGGNARFGGGSVGGASLSAAVEIIFNRSAVSMTVPGRRAGGYDQSEMALKVGTGTKCRWHWRPFDLRTEDQM